jgi:hypothetical protein
MIDSREAFLEMERVLSRRTFFKRVLKGAGAIAAFDRFGPSLFGQAQTPADMFNHGLQIVGAFGRLVIPVDQDPGWATFEPDITQYTLDVYIRQVFNLGNNLSFTGYLQAVNAFDAVPRLIGYGPAFVSMSPAVQGQYMSDVLIGNFESDGVQDILSFGGIFLLLATKMVFFQNFPHHLANPNSEFQQVLGNTPKTGFDIMGFRGPVGPAEEIALRERAANAPEIPGIDLRNPFI